MHETMMMMMMIIKRRETIERMIQMKERTATRDGYNNLNN